MASAATRRASRAPPPRATRAKPAVSYAESSSDTDSSTHLEQGDSEVDTPPRASSSRNALKPPAAKKRQRPSSSHSHHESDGHPKAKKHKSKPSIPNPVEVFDPIISSGVIPKWQTLPYHILVQVFRYATYPLYEDRTFQPLPSGRWLLSVARLCRGFAEPAFTVLYTTPPLVPMVVAHRLVDLLKADPIPMAYKYRQKVESLHIDVGQVAAYSLPGSGVLDLYGLIKDLPRLVDLEFYHQDDMSPYRKLDETIKWKYPETLFEALEYFDPDADPNRGDKTNGCQLRSWRWSSRLAGKKWSIDKISEIHLKPSFASLRKVAFVNYQVPYTKKDEADPKHENILAAALNNLKNLSHLIFESSTLMNYKLLPMLPKNLRHLELINCWEVVAEDFAPFLLTHGSQLRCLTLNHNQSLSLSFLPVLGEACPKLQVLRMNLTYFNLHATYHDSEPQYKQLLLPTEVPDWPSTLQTIELIQMRKWETEAAEMFFQSLLDSASNLPDLRKLSIQAILNIGWRDRASFRDKWVGSLARVFKRISDPPKVHTTITPAVVERSNVQVVIRKQEPAEAVADSFKIDAVEVKGEKGDVKESAETPKRRSPRSSSTSKVNSFPSSLGDPQPSKQATDVLKPTRSKNRSRISDVSASSIDQDAEKPSPPKRRLARRSTRQQAKVKYAESEDEGGQSTSASSVAGKKSRRSGASRELQLLKDTAGFHGVASFTTPPETPEDTTRAEDNALAGDSKGKGKAKEVIQGMCEIVEIRIDNLRPTETQVTEADFLDEEQPGDSDWDGDKDGDDGYAW